MRLLLRIGTGRRISHAYFKKALTSGTLVEWVAEEGGEIVATAGLALMPNPYSVLSDDDVTRIVTKVYM